MRILLVQRYFWPDVAPAAGVLRAVAGRLAEDGHAVTVLSAMPSYNEAYAGEAPPRRQTLDGCAVVRLRLPGEGKRSLIARSVNMAAFSVAVGFHALLRGRRYETIVASSMPPVALAATVRWVCRLIRRPYVYHCQDIYPEAALVSGVVRARWWTRLAAHIDKASVRAAARVVVLSSDMRRTLAERGEGSEHIRVVNNFFVDFGPEAPSGPPLEMRKPDGIYRVLFAGNLGLVQGLDTVLEAAWLLSAHRDIQFAFLGTGAREREVREAAAAAPNGSVVLFPYQPAPVALAMMREADLGLVSLAPGVIRVAYPSKTLAYLAAGCPVLAVVESDSELASFLRDSGVGSSCPPGNPRALADAVLEQRDRGGDDQAERARITRSGEEHFGIGRALDRWSELFADLAAGVSRREAHRRRRRDRGSAVG